MLSREETLPEVGSFSTKQGFSGRPHLVRPHQILILLSGWKHSGACVAQPPERMLCVLCSP